MSPVYHGGLTGVRAGLAPRDATGGGAAPGTGAPDAPGRLAAPLDYSCSASSCWAGPRSAVLRRPGRPMLGWLPLGWPCSGGLHGRGQGLVDQEHRHAVAHRVGQAGTG